MDAAPAPQPLRRPCRSVVLFLHAPGVTLIFSLSPSSSSQAYENFFGTRPPSFLFYLSLCFFSSCLYLNTGGVVALPLTKVYGYVSVLFVVFVPKSHFLNDVAR